MLFVTVYHALDSTRIEYNFSLLENFHGYAPQPNNMWLDMTNLSKITTAPHAPDRQAENIIDERLTTQTSQRTRQQITSTSDPTNALTIQATNATFLTIGLIKQTDVATDVDRRHSRALSRLFFLLFLFCLSSHVYK